MSGGRTDKDFDYHPMKGRVGVYEKMDGEISGSHSGEYKDDCLLGCCAV
jgi:hypothetical protein